MAGWSRERITSLLSGVKLENEIGSVQITELSSIEGEALINNRKAKLIFFYEWVIKGKWAGRSKGGEHEIRGEFEIPNLSEENDPSEIDVTVVYTENAEHDAGEAIKELLRTKGADAIRDQLAIYIKELKEDYAKDLILPTKDGKTPAKKPEQVKSVTRINNANLDQNNRGQDQLAVLKSLNFEEEFKCTASDFYDSLTREELVSRFTQDKARVVGRVGGEFSLFGGNVEGEFVELTKDQLIKQKWRFKNWPTAHYSTVSFQIESRDDCVLVKLSQTDVPAYEYEKVKEGWKRFYFEPMRRILGFGSSLY